MLTDRRSTLLNLIVEEYVDTAVPVGSQYVVRKYRIPFSPATVRIEMARLEEEGYISQPHTSAGRVPSDKGYRYYVETLMEEENLSRDQQETIRHQFHQAARDLEEWFQLAAAVLSNSVGNFAIVTSPRNQEARLRSLQLVALQELSALLILVMQEARIRQQVITFRSPVDQDVLNLLSGRLNALYSGLTLDEMAKLPRPDTDPANAEIESTVRHAVVDLMEQEAFAIGEVFRGGVREVLSQPEFAKSDRILELIDVLEQRTLASAIPIRDLAEHDIRVIIGSENSHESMRDCSFILARYGSEGGPSGVVAVLGPTRMRYARTIPTVRYLSAVLGELIAHI
jgi:heat-inducible transcriptional repressor